MKTSRRKQTYAALLLLLAPTCAAPAGRAAVEDSITAADVQAHVDHLASDELGGRSAARPEGRLAADYVAASFERSGLEPLGDEGTWFQAVDDPELSPNVVAIRRGRGDEFVLITAHYDHLAPREDGEDRIYNGADDNASGTAVVLELADAFGALDEPLEASIVLVAFTAEERGLVGSRYFVAHPPFELERVRGVLNLDMVSRGEERLIFCEGGSSAPELVAAAERARREVGLVILYDRHPEWLRASDHHPFLVRGVPTLYFGVEDHSDYHRVTDHADRILADLAARVGRLAFRIALDVAARP